jgi:hypothetical protein
MNLPSELPLEESLAQMRYYGPLAGVVDEGLLIDGSPIVSSRPQSREHKVSLLGADTESVFTSIGPDKSLENGA